MEGRQSNGEPKIYILTDDTPSFLTIPDYNGSEQNTDGHSTLETNLNVRELLSS